MPQCNARPRPKGVLPFDMRRREFITLLGGAALSWPLAAQAERIRRIGVLSPYPADDPDLVDRFVAFRQGLHEHGWTEGHNLQIDYRWAGADAVRIRSYAAELGAETARRDDGYPLLQLSPHYGRRPTPYRSCSWASAILWDKALLQAWHGQAAMLQDSPGSNFRSAKSGSVLSRDWRRASLGSPSFSTQNSDRFIYIG